MQYYYVESNDRVKLSHVFSETCKDLDPVSNSPEVIINININGTLISIAIYLHKYLFFCLVLWVIYTTLHLPEMEVDTVSLNISQTWTKLRFSGRDLQKSGCK